MPQLTFLRSTRHYADHFKCVTFFKKCSCNNFMIQILFPHFTKSSLIWKLGLLPWVRQLAKRKSKDLNLGSQNLLKLCFAIGKGGIVMVDARMPKREEDFWNFCSLQC